MDPELQREVEHAVKRALESTLEREVELSARRLFEKDGQAHREFLEKQLLHAKRFLGILLTAAAIVLTVLGFRSLSDFETRAKQRIAALEQQAKEEVTDRIVDNIVDKEVVDRAKARVRNELEREIQSATDKLEAAARTTVEAQLQKQQATIVQRVTESVAKFTEPGTTLAQYFEGVGTPVGTVVAWPGPLPPEGSHWHACNGARVGFTEELWAVLRGHYNNPDADKVDFILLPNFQGYFLRGLATDNSVDPDGTERKVGSIQQHAVGRHAHPDDHYVYESGHRGTQGGGDYVTAHGKLHATGVYDGGETRPTNRAVHWVIRVR